MSKKETTNQQKSSIDELLEKGNTTLTADSRKAVYEMGTTLVGLIPEDVKWTRSAVEHKSGTFSPSVFTQTYSLIKFE